MLTLVSKDNGASWGQLASYPAKGGFLGLVQTGDRLIGVGTFEKDSEPVCYIEKAALIDAELKELTSGAEPIPVPPPAPTPTPTPTPAPTPTPTPTPTVEINKVLADELEGIGNSLIRIANCLRILAENHTDKIE